MIRIVDYGVGNVQAFMTMYKRLGIPAERARTPDDLAAATKLILPGVGAFDHAMERLNASGMREALTHKVVVQKVPVLGVCVGMQMLASGSNEGILPGLDWIPGHVRAFEDSPQTARLPMPHMGWNDVQPTDNGRLFRDLEMPPRFYFLHSYYFDCTHPEHVSATATYGLTFACAVSAGHIHGVQCHPEKSHHFGTQLLKNFAEL